MKVLGRIFLKSHNYVKTKKILSPSPNAKEQFPHVNGRVDDKKIFLGGSQLLWQNIYMQCDYYSERTKCSFLDEKKAYKYNTDEMINYKLK
jgi:hypothetical protein